MTMSFFRKGKQMKIAIVLVITMVLAVGPLYGEATEQPPPTPSQEQPEVLTRGPVHEAFAEPVDLQVQTGLVAPNQPPANIEETPPAERPTGEQFVWVPGYWAWDSERNGYIWVSGCWRAAPPNRYWMPGYWAKVSEGWEWIPGFWAPVTGVQQIEYLPAPPTLENVQPPGLSPSPDNIWVPPCWYWYQGRYILRPGYWLVAQEDWVWAPSHYVCTPRGYLFVTGCWDYSLTHRGVLFAPVYIPRHVYERPGFSLSLGVVVDIGMLKFGLFTSPSYCHYYFGDYYDNVYIGIGIYPWFECEQRHTWYDPLYEHTRWRHRIDEPRWAERERHDYDLRRADKDFRPPRTYREMETWQTRLPQPQRNSIQMAEPMRTVVADKSSTMKFEQIKAGARQQLSRQTTDVHNFGEQRSRWESMSAGQKTIQPSTEHKGLMTQPHQSNLTGPERVNIPSPPIADRQGMMSIFRKGPPSRPADEQKTDFRDTHSNRGAQSNTDTRRGRN
jgi:hypothetical protein